jgi:SLT domain-containing protein
VAFLSGAWAIACRIELLRYHLRDRQVLTERPRADGRSGMGRSDNPFTFFLSRRQHVTGTSRGSRVSPRRIIKISETGHSETIYLSGSIRLERVEFLGNHRGESSLTYQRQAIPRSHLSHRQYRIGSSRSSEMSALGVLNISEEGHSKITYLTGSMRLERVEVLEHYYKGSSM